MTNDATQPGRIPEEAQGFSYRDQRTELLTRLASEGVSAAMFRLKSGQSSPDYDGIRRLVDNSIQLVISATEISIADRIRERAEELRDSNDGSSRDAATLFYDLADAIAPQSTERHLAQE